MEIAFLMGKIETKDSLQSEISLQLALSSPHSIQIQTELNTKVILLSIKSV